MTRIKTLNNCILTALQRRKEANVTPSVSGKSTRLHRPTLTIDV